MNSWISTHTGKQFDPLNPQTPDIVIEDIAHALGNMCRFAGHTKEFYSVAQHSVLVSQILEEQGHDLTTQLRGLLHDATEAYMVDIPRPLKIQSFMAEYRVAEDRLEAAIAERFFNDGWTVCTPLVKKADVIALATEARDLMPQADALHSWEMLKHIEPMDQIIVAQGPYTAGCNFLTRYRQLVQELGKQKEAIA